MSLYRYVTVSHLAFTSEKLPAKDIALKDNLSGSMKAQTYGEGWNHRSHLLQLEGNNNQDQLTQNKTYSDGINKISTVHLLLFRNRNGFKCIYKISKTIVYFMVQVVSVNH